MLKKPYSDGPDFAILWWVELGEGWWPGHSGPAVGKEGAGTHGLGEEQ